MLGFQLCATIPAWKFLVISFFLVKYEVSLLMQNKEKYQGIKEREGMKQLSRAKDKLTRSVELPPDRWLLRMYLIAGHSGARLSS
jgi:hypothetical protein